MDLLKTVLGASDGKGMDVLAKQFGLDQTQVAKAMGQLLPALKTGVKRNTSSPGGLESLLGAIGSGDHEKYLDRPELAREQASVEDGNAILGRLFGSKDVSREVASQASQKTGIDSDILKKMLPVAATMLMGSLSKNKNHLSSGAGASADGLAGLLDANGDGSMTDDVMGMLKKMF